MEIVPSSQALEAAKQFANNQWPQLVNLNADDAVAALKQIRPDLNVIKHPAGGMVRRGV